MRRVCCRYSGCKDHREALSELLRMNSSDKTAWLNFHRQVLVRLPCGSAFSSGRGQCPLIIICAVEWHKLVACPAGVATFRHVYRLSPLGRVVRLKGGREQ